VSAHPGHPGACKWQISRGAKIYLRAALGPIEAENDAIGCEQQRKQASSSGRKTRTLQYLSASLSFILLGYSLSGFVPA